MHLQFSTIAGHFESSKRTLARQGIITVNPVQQKIHFTILVISWYYILFCESIIFASHA